jgi:prepilin-type N-terminal cleavage/methylation domain-containing protein
MKLKHNTKSRRAAQGGFSLIEVIIAIAVMSIGLLAVVASIGAAVQATASAQEDLIARQKALEALESIYTARNSQQVPFTSINNTASGGIFKSGPQKLLCAGPDGLVGTGDDVACLTSGGVTCPHGGVECWVLPGPDGILGTADDETYSLYNFTRTITFNQVLLSTGLVNSTMMAVTVTVTYTKDGIPARSYTVNGLISQYN